MYIQASASLKPTYPFIHLEQLFSSNDF